ncbi:hypothetical protein [Candidatus Poriferisodalis sp.]|uniref:hypothetical protein n=1 Tax=Candidatus Poriferisodalis sp. TaxID=3101277 RepID=UPI003B5BDA9F
MTEDRPPADAPDAVGDLPAALSAARAAERRSLLVPVLSTACAALIAGVLGLAVVGFNTLRDDIRSLDAKIDTQIGSVRGEIGSVRGEIGMLRDDMHAEIGMLRNDMNARFAQVDAVLLDHTERLARIETTLGVESRPVQQP